MPISVRFAKRPGYDTLQIRITVDGKEGSPFSTTEEGRTIQVVGAWDQKKQKRTDRTDSALNFNNKLDKLRSKLTDIYEKQRSDDYPITPKSIQIEYQTGRRPDVVLVVVKPPNQLVDIYRAHMDRLSSYVKTENELASSTLSKWEYGFTYLEDYLKQTGQPDFRVDLVSVGWAKSYHTHLMKTGPMSADSATRYVKKLSETIDAWAEHGTPHDRRINPIAGYKFGRGKTKDVYFLEKRHLERFWQLDNRGKSGECIWWMGVVMLTGLDYPDAVRYVQNRAIYDREGVTKPSIVIRRDKPPKNECKIPVWPELTALLQHIPTGNPPSADEINDYMKGVEVLIGFDERFTLKIGRKTAGYIFLLRGYTIRAVSRILGHSSIAITERYYVKVTGELVDQETDSL